MAIFVLVVLLVAVMQVAINEYRRKREREKWMYATEYLCSHICSDKLVTAKLVSDPLKETFMVQWDGLHCAFFRTDGAMFRAHELKIKRDDTKFNQ